MTNKKFKLLCLMVVIFSILFLGGCTSFQSVMTAVIPPMVIAGAVTGIILAIYIGYEDNWGEGWGFLLIMGPVLMAIAFYFIGLLIAFLYSLVFGLF